MRAVAATVVLLALAGCAGNQVKPLEFGTFPASEYEALQKSGSSTVTGQVFLKTRGGDVKFGAGSEVVLIPATSYSATLMQAYTEDRPAGTPDPRVKQYSHRTQADGSGYFTFRNVPAGRYYVNSSVNWEAPTQFGLSHQGGFILVPVSVGDGEEARIMVTR
ncbi:hypothetical protein ACKI1H_27175 [Pseudomonas sp. YH-1]|uniref:hypothetical protein n=1 Tax=Pseudomonas sp. YH-1 TaxID=3384787 RepID=UPI003F7E6BC8